MKKNYKGKKKKNKETFLQIQESKVFSTVSDSNNRK